MSTRKKPDAQANDPHAIAAEGTFTAPTSGPFVGWDEQEVRAWYQESVVRLANLRAAMSLGHVDTTEAMQASLMAPAYERGSLPSVAMLGAMFGGIGKAQAVRQLLGLEVIHTLTDEHQLVTLADEYEAAHLVMGKTAWAAQRLPGEDGTGLGAFRVIWPDSTATEWRMPNMKNRYAPSDEPPAHPKG